MMSDTVKSFNILASLSILRNYFDGSTKLFSELYLIKFLAIFLLSTRITRLLYFTERVDMYTRRLESYSPQCRYDSANKN